MWSRLQRWLEGPPIEDPEQAEAFRREGLAASVGRVRVILPLMVVVHLLHVLAFRPDALERASLAPVVLTWRDAITSIHLISAVVAAGLAGAVWLVRPQRQAPLVPLVGLSYLLHGAVIAGADQLHHPTVAPYLAYAAVIAGVLVWRPLTAAAVFLVGVVALEACLVAMQPDREVLRSMIFNGPSISIALVVAVGYLHRARKRDFVQRATIDAQATRLLALNEALERRVQEQVDEIVLRAEAIDQLNARLRSRVRDRSKELARALDRLGRSVPSGSLVGTRIDARYEVVRTIGRGGMGTVYEAIDAETGERVAVKTIHAGRHVSLGLLRRFLVEAEAVAALDHPGVVGMRAIDVDAEGTVYQVQELASGVSLDVLLEQGPLDPAPIASILRVLAEVLAHAHAHGVVHRDVKPSNLLLCEEAPGLRLLDFGIARVREVLADDRDVDTLPTAFDGDGPVTRVGMVMGTPGYMAPEQRLGAELTSPATDVYALGAVGLALWTGTRPDALDPLGGFEGQGDVAAVIRACLAEEPDDRPTAEDVARGLEGPELVHWVRTRDVTRTPDATSVD